MEEGKPDQLLQRFSCGSLERLFLQLCYEHEKLNQADISENDEVQTLLDDQMGEVESMTCEKVKTSQEVNPERNVSKLIESQVVRRQISFYSKSKALLYKNAMVLRRHRLFMFFNIVLPVANFLIFFQAVGRPPSGLQVSYSVTNLSLASPCGSTVDNITCSSTLDMVSGSQPSLNFKIHCRFPCFVTWRICWKKKT